MVDLLTPYHAMFLHATEIEMPQYVASTLERSGPGEVGLPWLSQPTDILTYLFRAQAIGLLVPIASLAIGNQKCMHRKMPLIFRGV